MTGRLLILSLSFGMGHISAAQCVAESWREIAGNEARVIDAIAWFPGWLRLLYVIPYWLMIRHCPMLWRALFSARVRRVHRHTIPPALLRLGTGRLLKEIRHYDPSVILAAEVGACEIAALYKTLLDRRVHVAAMITDFASEPAWVQPGVDVYFAPSQQVARELSQWGADAVSTALVGIPVRKEFYRTLSKIAARERCGVAPNRSTILMMAGGMGPGRLDELILELDRRIEEQAQIIAIAGHDRVLLKRIRKLQPERLKVRALGWTEHVHFFMAAADLLITKPGALTLSEAFAMNLPVIAFGPLPGPEEENAREVVRRGGWSSSDSAEAAALALGILRGEIRGPSSMNADSASELIVRILQGLPSPTIEVNCV